MAKKVRILQAGHVNEPCLWPEGLHLAPDPNSFPNEATCTDSSAPDITDVQPRHDLDPMASLTQAGQQSPDKDAVTMGARFEG